MIANAIDARRATEDFGILRLALLLDDRELPVPHPPSPLAPLQPVSSDVEVEEERDQRKEITEDPPEEVSREGAVRVEGMRRQAQHQEKLSLKNSDIDQIK